MHNVPVFCKFFNAELIIREVWLLLLWRHYGTEATFQLYLL